MRRFLLTVGVWLVFGVAPALADTALVKVNDLVEQAKAFDGKTVTVEGEVIGDVMIRGASGWVNVSDGTNDIGVWASAEALRTIGHAGRYHYSGDKVRVTGEFRRADPEQGGDLTLRAASLEVLAPGSAVDHSIAAGRPLLAVLALAVAGVLGYLRWRARVPA